MYVSDMQLELESSLELESVRVTELTPLVEGIVVLEICTLFLFSTLV